MHAMRGNMDQDLASGRLHRLTTSKTAMHHHIHRQAMRLDQESIMSQIQLRKYFVGGAPLAIKVYPRSRLASSQCIDPRLDRSDNVSRGVMERAWADLKWMMKLIWREFLTRIEDLDRGPPVMLQENFKTIADRHGQIVGKGRNDWKAFC